MFLAEFLILLKNAIMACIHDAFDLPKGDRRIVRVLNDELSVRVLQKLVRQLVVPHRGADDDERKRPPLPIVSHSPGLGKVSHFLREFGSGSHWPSLRQ